MVLMIAYLSCPLAISFIVCKWSDCDWMIQNGADDCLFVLVLLFVGGKWSDCDWATHNSVDIGLLSHL